MPRRSWYTSTCPLQCGPAPMPMVGTESAFVTAAATAGGTHSSTCPRTNRVRGGGIFSPRGPLV
eukprot:1188346-Pyramimonas_sp.AAC.1